ncbi:MAG: FprA family A-type flavoprotein [Erysipelotrichaceae bacterium]|nr:FprA family A-type flavoprotein [Erysipelotrichaceae bacterium]
MYKVSNDIYYIGVNDHDIDLFESQYVVENGMSYNSYLIDDDFIAILDSVDEKFFDEWMDNILKVLNGRKPTFFVIHHMEFDHAANIMRFLEVFKDTILVGNAKTFKMFDQFFRNANYKKLVVNENDTLNLGHHNLSFIFAPMVHWIEVMFSYDELDKVLFSADAFGKFGALDVDEEWACEARRYYFNIVGKYGIQVQSALKKAMKKDIATICPLHGPILNENLKYYIDLYNTWSSYVAETSGVAIFYTSVYGHTKQAALLLEKKLKELHVDKVVVTDLARCDMAEAIEDAFRYNKIVFATTTYNASIFPFMNEFINHLVENNFQNKVVAFIENGSWALNAYKVMKEKLANCKDMTYIDEVVHITSSLSQENLESIATVAKQLVNSTEKKVVVEEIKHEEKKKVKYVCSVCGYVYEGEELPEDFHCPLCNKPAEYFKKVQE